MANVDTVEMAIKILKGEQPIAMQSDYCYKQAIDIAIIEMEKAISKKPINNGNWSPKTCPTCGEHLSEHKGDGYYSDSICLKSCPKCRQSLKWS